ncbi:Tetraspanin-10 [Zea mays]|uniref:Tetraspanin-10 n=1 Tax=Zea mays TaxID=4577 RepID=A0A317YEI6_MAIZE|nr:Tetraspanin-10 [Zea mays]
MGSTSAFVIRWINFFTMILALLVVGFGFWMSTHDDECRRTLTVPVIALGGVIFLISLVGFLGAWKNISCLLWTYLIMLFVVLVAIMVFTVLAFIITNSGSGHTVPGARCGFPALNASYFDLSYHPASANADCKLYRNARSVRCYDCSSCKAGVAQYMKTEWRVVAIFNVILFVILSFVYFVGCCARRNAGGGDAKGRGR